MSRFKIGTTVYVNSSWNTAEECTILSFVPNESSTGQNVYTLHSTLNCGTFAATEDCIFSTKLKALAAAKIARQMKIENYESEIKTLKDLIEFPLKHCLNGEEYTDEEAVTAYKLRAKELTGMFSDLPV